MNGEEVKFAWKGLSGRLFRLCLSFFLIFSVSAAFASNGSGSDPGVYSPASTGVFLPGEQSPNGNEGFLPPGDNSGKSNDTGLRRRVVPQKPLHTKVEEGVYKNLITVKFIEGSDIRLRNGRLVSLGSADLRDLDDVLARPAVARLRRLFSRPEPDLLHEKLAGQEMSGEELADLNLYYRVIIDDNTDTENFVDALNSLDIVEIAYPEPVPYTAMANPYDIPPTTPSFVANQGYLNAPPQGIGAQWAWTNKSYSRGQGVKVIDIEFGWNVNHEDLALTSANVLGGTNSYDDHGTAVLGEIIGYNNAYGVTGISSSVAIGMVSVTGLDNLPNVPNSINLAASNTSFGDIILLELHYPGPSSGQPCTCNCTQFEYIPMEYWSANFDAIKTATANGKIIVEAAGNGSMNLDNTIYGNLFKRSYRDSGAILVGAGTSATPHSPLCWTNYGSRVDVQGWGENVTTTGYGYAFSGGDVNQRYTYTFSGTSSASPIVVGSAAVIQSYFKNVKGSTLNAYAVRQLLVNTGTAQGGTNQIGPLPNLVNSLSQELPKPDIKANGSDGPVSVYSTVPVKLTISFNPGGFSNVNADWWVVAYNQQLNTWYYMNPSGQWTTQPTTISQGPLYSFSSRTIFNSTMSPGNYTVYFMTDLYQNGILDNPYYYDYVTVTIY